MKQEAQRSSRLTLPRQCSLKSKKQIDHLFKEGYVFKAYPLLVRYLPSDGKAQKTDRILVSVPKRNFKRAVDRNKLKRRIREAYRVQQNVFSDKVCKDFLNIAFLYIGREQFDYRKIEKSMRLILGHIAQSNEKNIPK